MYLLRAMHAVHVLPAFSTSVAQRFFRMTLSSGETTAATLATITPGPLLHAKRDSAICGFISGNSGTIIV